MSKQEPLVHEHYVEFIHHSLCFTVFRNCSYLLYISFYIYYIITQGMKVFF